MHKLLEFTQKSSDLDCYGLDAQFHMLKSQPTRRWHVEMRPLGVMRRDEVMKVRPAWCGWDLEKPESLLSLSLLCGDTMRGWLSTIQAGRESSQGK